MSHSLTRLDAQIPPDLVGATRVVTPKQFERLCRKYRDLRLELTSTGELIVMSGTGPETGRRNAILTYQLVDWTRKDGTGICFDSSTMFALPNEARRSPDGSWVKREKWEHLTKQEKESFSPICPDFVVELRSKTDRVSQLRSKMEEYIANGAMLGWLIEPLVRRVHIYRPNHDALILEDPETVSGDPLLP